MTLPPKARFIREVSGALRNTLNAHGAITKQNLNSAAKRVAGQIHATVAQWIEQGDSTSTVAGSIPARRTKFQTKRK